MTVDRLRQIEEYIANWNELVKPYDPHDEFTVAFIGMLAVLDELVAEQKVYIHGNGG